MLVFHCTQGYQMLSEDCNCTKGIGQILVMCFNSWTWITPVTSPVCAQITYWTSLRGKNPGGVPLDCKGTEAKCLRTGLWLSLLMWTEPWHTVSDLVLLKGCSRSLNFGCSLWSKSLWSYWWVWIQPVGCFPPVLPCPKCRNRNWTSRGNLHLQCMMPYGCL